MEKINVWMNRNKKLDIFAIMKKTHAFPKRLEIFEEFMGQENSLDKEEDKKFSSA